MEAKERTQQLGFSDHNILERHAVSNLAGLTQRDRGKTSAFTPFGDLSGSDVAFGSLTLWPK